MTGNGADVANIVRDTIYRATLLLDDQQWVQWLDLCDDSFHYFQGSHKDLATMVKLLPKHNTDHSPLRRHATVYTVGVAEDGKTASAVTSFVVYQNLLDGVNSHIDAGESRLFLVGRYLDTLRLEHDRARFIKREVRLDNRRLDKGSHWPI